MTVSHAIPRFIRGSKCGETRVPESSFPTTPGILSKKTKNRKCFRSIFGQTYCCQWNAVMLSFLLPQRTKTVSGSKGVWNKSCQRQTQQRCFLEFDWLPSGVGAMAQRGRFIEGPRDLRRVNWLGGGGVFKDRTGPVKISTRFFLFWEKTFILKKIHNSWRKNTGRQAPAEKFFSRQRTKYFFSSNISQCKGIGSGGINLWEI